jgi:hypothetical protein
MRKTSSLVFCLPFIVPHSSFIVLHYDHLDPHTPQSRAQPRANDFDDLGGRFLDLPDMRGDDLAFCA